VKDRQIDELLKHASEAPPRAVNPETLDRISQSIENTLRPVRPLPPTWVLSLGLIAISAGIASAGAARLGFNGIHKMNVLERSLIFPALGILVWLTATAFATEMIPGSRRRVASGTMLIVSSLALFAIFAVLFRDYRTDHFLSQGIVCLVTGLLHAIPTALASWLLLRRGFAVNPVTSGLSAGTLGGLAGVIVLELHCPNFQALHILVWHIAVPLVSAALGAWLTWASVRWSGQRR
jgi:hypothetical protein